MEQETLVPPVAETQNPATEPTETPEVVTPETETQTEQEPKAEDADRTVKRLERRIDRLTAARYQTAAEAAQARKEAEELKARLAQYEQQEPQQETLTPEKVLPIARQMAEYLRTQERVQDRVQQVMKAGKALDGFDAACNAVNEELPFYSQNGAPTPFLGVVMECESPAVVLHHLGRNPDLAEELARLTPTQQARRLDRLEAELNRKPEPKASNAPKPIEPLRGTGGGANKDPAQMSDAEFAKWRRAQIAQRG